jgi:hypothetical protein
MSDGQQIGHLGGSTRYTANLWSTSTAPGETFIFSGLDLDIVTDAIGHAFDETNFFGSSLDAARVTLTWSDGFTSTLPLNMTHWGTTQVLVTPMVPPVPEPDGLPLMIAGAGAIAFAARRKMLR